MPIVIKTGVTSPGGMTHTYVFVWSLENEVRSLENEVRFVFRIALITKAYEELKARCDYWRQARFGLLICQEKTDCSCR